MADNNEYIQMVTAAIAVALTTELGIVRVNFTQHDPDIWSIKNWEVMKNGVVMPLESFFSQETINAVRDQCMKIETVH